MADGQQEPQPVVRVRCPDCRSAWMDSEAAARHRCPSRPAPAALDRPHCDWCGAADGGEMVLVAAEVDGVPARACRSCWDSDELALVRAVVAARRELSAGAPGARYRAEAVAQAVRRAVERDALPMAPVAVTGDGVRVGDGLAIGGRTFVVVRTVPVAGGVKLRFAGGELLSLHRDTALTVMRPGLPGPSPAPAPAPR